MNLKLRTKNNKGKMEMEEIVYWLLALIILSVFIAVIIMIKNVGHESMKIFPQSNASKDFLFTAEKINVTDESHCTKISDKEYGNCKAHEDIYFVTTVRNDGTMERRFWGGKTICKVECKGDKCTPIDISACTNDVTSGTGLCAVKIGDSSVCDAGYFNFDPGVYYIYPVATCYLDDTYGCSTTNSQTSNTQILTQAPKDYSTNYIKITVIG
jgi:hypothetical protein